MILLLLLSTSLLVTVPAMEEEGVKRHLGSALKLGLSDLKRHVDLKDSSVHENRLSEDEEESLEEEEQRTSKRFMGPALNVRYKTWLVAAANSEKRQPADAPFYPVYHPIGRQRNKAKFRSKAWAYGRRKREADNEARATEMTSDADPVNIHKYKRSLVEDNGLETGPSDAWMDGSLESALEGFVTRELSGEGVVNDNAVEMRRAFLQQLPVGLDMDEAAFDKRHLGATMNSWRYRSNKGKRDMADDAIALDNSMEKRHIGSALRQRQSASRDAYEKRHIGAAIRQRQRFVQNNNHETRQLEIEKKHLGAALRLRNVYKKHLGSALRGRETDKRHIGSALRMRQTDKKNIGSALRLRGSDEDYYNNNDAFYQLSKKHLGASLSQRQVHKKVPNPENIMDEEQDTKEVRQLEIEKKHIGAALRQRFTNTRQL